VNTDWRKKKYLTVLNSDTARQAGLEAALERGAA
jgi:hypothetical protein